MSRPATRGETGEEDNDDDDSTVKTETGPPPPFQNVSTLLKGPGTPGVGSGLGLRQPTCMAYDPDPDGWMLWSATVDEDEEASGFSSAVSIEWYEAFGVTFCCDTHHNRIVSIQSDGRAYTYAGDDCSHRDGKTTNAAFCCPSGVAVTPTGEVVVADTGNHCLRLCKAGHVTTIAGTPRVPGDKDGVGTYTKLCSPTGICVDAEEGSIYFSDSGNNKIKKVRGARTALYRPPQQWR